MNFFKMRWPDLNLEVRCCGLTVNAEAFKTLTANFPVKVVQGHEMTGGWLLRDRCVPLMKTPFTLAPDSLKEERMREAPVGRISLLTPRGSMTELLVKYDSCADTRDYIPVAQVVDEDLPILQKAGQEQWAAATRWKKVLYAEFIGEED